jgi:chemotaxis receptor (MCP) glutamine deamidase CheD
MKICGVEIKGSEAVICLLDYQDGLFTLPDCRVRKVEFNKRNNTGDIRYFQSTFTKLMADYSVTDVVIKERPLKGKFAGGALGFKMEAAIQCIENLNVHTMNAQEFKESLKRNPVVIDFSETGLKVFQEQAFNTAYAKHMNIQYPPKLETEG